MNSSGFKWVVSPEAQLIPAIRKYGRDALIAIHAVATYWGQFVQDEARTGAPWEDRTANARSGIFFAVDGFGLETITGVVKPGLYNDAFVVTDNEGNEYEVNRAREDDVSVESGDANTLIIALGHTVFYGKYLEDPEFEQGGKYAIIMSTIEKNLPKLERMLKNSLK